MSLTNEELYGWKQALNLYVRLQKDYKAVYFVGEDGIDLFCVGQDNKNTTFKFFVTDTNQGSVLRFNKEEIDDCESDFIIHLNVRTKDLYVVAYRSLVPMLELSEDGDWLTLTTIGRKDLFHEVLQYD